MLCISLSTSLLCPCWILYPWCNYLMLLYRLSIGHANDTLHWAYFLTCPDVYSLCEWSLWSLFIVIIHFWSSIVVTIPCVIIRFCLFACFNLFCLIASCLLHRLSRFLLTMIVLCCCFQEILVRWFKSFTDSRVRCEWVLFNCSQLTC